MAQVVMTDGKMRHIKLDSDPDVRIEQLQRAVGGYVEMVGEIEMGACVYANERGRLLNLPPNRLMSELLDRLILGDVVVLSPREALDSMLDDVPGTTFH